MGRLLAAFAVFVIAGCTEHGKGGGGGDTCVFLGTTHQAGEVFPAGDGCNTCSCDGMGGVVCTELACEDGGVTAACAPANGCPEGPACGNTCCGRGERCDAATGTCLCGTGAACGNGDTCEAAGPGGGDLCGSICCGASGPCPQ